MDYLDELYQRGLTNDMKEIIKGGAGHAEAAAE